VLVLRERSPLYNDNELLNLKKDLIKLIKVTFYPEKYSSHEYVSYTTDLPFN